MSTIRPNEKIKVLIADDEENQLSTLTASLIICDDPKIRLAAKVEAVKGCFDLRSTQSYNEVKAMITARQKAFIPHLALIDVNFEKNQDLPRGKAEDPRYLGIELAALIKQKSNGFTKVILNTGFADDADWKRQFERRGFVVKDKYDPSDSDNTVYRKEKRGDKRIDSLTHLIRPILEHLASISYSQFDPLSKRRVTVLHNGFSRKKPTPDVEEKLLQLDVVASGITYKFGDLLHFHSEIVMADKKVFIRQAGIADRIRDVIAAARPTAPGEFPCKNGPWKCAYIQEKFVDYFKEDPSRKVRALTIEVGKLASGFLIPVIANTKFKKHTYTRSYTLHKYLGPNGEEKIANNPASFTETMVNNVVVRITASLVGNLCEQEKLHYKIKGSNAALAHHKAAFKQYIDDNLANVKIHEEATDHKHLSSFYVTRLGLTYKEKEDSYILTDLCKIEQQIYEACYHTVLEEIKQITRFR